MHAPLGTFLDKSDSAAQVMAHAHLLLRLARRFAAIAPDHLTQSARVANFKGGKIIIHADNGAVAAKLRQMSQRLSGEMAKGGLECTALEVKVHPRSSPYPGSAGPHLKPLSGKTCGTLRDTASGLPPGNLRAALETLLERAARKE